MAEPEKFPPLTKAQKPDVKRLADLNARKRRAKQTKRPASVLNDVDLKVREARERGRTLQERQRSFVYHLVHFRLSPIQAARHAGYQNAKSASAKLIEQPHIKQAIALAQAEYAVASRVTKSEVIEGLKDAAERAKILDDTSSLVAAWREIGKMCGFYEPVKHEVSISVNGKVTLEKMAAMKDEELLALLDDDPNVLEGEFKQLPAPGDPDYDGE